MAGNAKRLAKNTLYMYIRMFVLLIISLYTSRVLLKQLGVEDYGVYNVVGSIVVMFNSLRGIFASSTQRFLNFEMGKGNTERLNTIFNMSVIINLIIALVLVVCVEIVGWWFLNYKINIDPSRLTAAKWVFQFSVISTVIALMTTPFDALIIANERMGFYAGASILDGVLKLLIIYLLAISPFDKLISYGFLLFCVHVLMRFVSAFYCHRNFKESRYKWCWDKPLFKDMASFAGWNFLANTGYTLSNEGINMLLNVFGGPIVNAARGITYQVRSALQQFISNVNKATDPYAMKLYAKDDMDGYYKILYAISKILFSVYACMAIPIFFFTDEILQLWLGQVPEYASIFIKLILVHGVVRSYLSPLNHLFYSANKVKYYQMCSLILSILVFFTAWFVLHLGYSYYSPFFVMVIYVVITYVVVLIQAKVLCNFPLINYLKSVTLPTLMSFIICVLFSYLISNLIAWNSYWFIVACILMAAISLVVSLFVGFSKNERRLLLSIVKK